MPGFIAALLTLLATYACTASLVMTPDLLTIQVQPGAPRIDPTPTQVVVTPEPDTLLCNRRLTDGVNMRAEKSTTSSIVDRIALGTCAYIEMEEDVGGGTVWYWVCLPTVEGYCNPNRKGWVSSRSAAVVE